MKFNLRTIKHTKGYIYYSLLCFFLFILFNNFFLILRNIVIQKPINDIYFYTFGRFCDWTPRIIPYFIYSFLIFLTLKLLFIFFIIKFWEKKSEIITNLVGIFYSFDALAFLIISISIITPYNTEFYFFSSAPTFNFSKTIGIHCSITFLLMYILSLATHSYLAKITTKQLLYWFFISLTSFFISIILFYILKFIAFKL